MQVLWVITAFWSLALAAPEAGYSNPSPLNSHSFGGQPHVFGGNALPSSGPNTFSFPGSFVSSGTYSPSFADNSQSSGGYFYPAPAPRPRYGPPPTTTPRPPPAGGGLLGDAPVTQAPTRIMKSIFAFTSGERTEPPPTSGAGGLGPPPPRKVHYKIIFIKAPSYQAQTQQVAQGPARDEHKTLIYVLVKKPEEAAAASAPTPAPTAPSRPEVYFIRYKARTHAAGHGDGSYGVPARTGGPY